MCVLHGLFIRAIRQSRSQHAVQETGWKRRKFGQNVAARKSRSIQKSKWRATLKAVQNWKGNNNFLVILIIYSPSFVFVILVPLSSDSTFPISYIFSDDLLCGSSCKITRQYKYNNT